MALLASTQPAFAMNWEGHDDWMNDIPPVQALIHAMPDAKPLPSRGCPSAPIAGSNNPYEQIPLPRHHCPVLQKEKSS
jgi:hypothetical protein